MRFIFDLLYLFAALVFGPVAIYRMVRHGRYRHGWAQRRGLIQRQAPSKRCIWLHAVSVGEVNAAKTLLAEIEKRYTDCEIVVTTTTDTGYARAQSIFGSRYTVSYFPEQSHLTTSLASVPSYALDADTKSEFFCALSFEL